MALLRELIQPAQLERCGDRSFPVLSMTMHDGIMLQSDRFKKSLASVDQSAYKVVRRNQLVVGFPIDEGVLYIQQVVDAGIMSPAYDVWNVDEMKVDLRYFELCLHSPQSMMFYKTNLRGTTARRRSLPKETLLSLPVPVPSMERQREIASALDRLQALIRLRQHQLCALDELIKARFVEMFDGGDYPKTTITDLVAGKVSSAKKDFAQDDTIRYIDISSIDNQRNTMTGYTEYVLSEAPSRAQQHIIKGDILISTVRPNLRNVALTTYSDDNLVASSGFCVLRASKCLPSYLMAIVCSDEFTEAMCRVVTGANYPAIKDSDVLSYTVPVPPMGRQREFEAFTTQIDKSKVVDLSVFTNRAKSYII